MLQWENQVFVGQASVSL